MQPSLWSESAFLSCHVLASVIGRRTPMFCLTSKAEHPHLCNCFTGSVSQRIQFCFVFGSSDILSRGIDCQVGIFSVLPSYMSFALHCVVPAWDLRVCHSGFILLTIDRISLDSLRQCCKLVSEDVICYFIVSWCH